MTEQEISAREQKAIDLFMQGYNCSQAVFCACADLYDIPQPLALRIAASFGGGMGRMRLTCGAATAMFLLAGLKKGQTEPHDAQQKLTNYAYVQDLAEAFKQEHGSMTCSELLAIRAKEGTVSVDSGTEPKPAERNEAYYHQRPCLKMITSAVRIYCRSL